MIFIIFVSPVIIFGFNFHPPSHNQKSAFFQITILLHDFNFIDFSLFIQIDEKHINFIRLIIYFTPSPLFSITLCPIIFMTLCLILGLIAEFISLQVPRAPWKEGLQWKCPAWSQT